MYIYTLRKDTTKFRDFGDYDYTISDYKYLCHTKKFTKEEFKDMCDKVKQNVGQDLCDIKIGLIKYFDFQDIDTISEQIYVL